MLRASLRNPFNHGQSLYLPQPDVEEIKDPATDTGGQFPVYINFLNRGKSINSHFGYYLKKFAPCTVILLYTLVAQSPL